MTLVKYTHELANLDRCGTINNYLSNCILCKACMTIAAFWYVSTPIITTFIISCVYINQWMSWLVSLKGIIPSMYLYQIVLYYKCILYHIYTYGIYHTCIVYKCLYHTCTVYPNTYISEISLGLCVSLMLHSRPYCIKIFEPKFQTIFVFKIS